MTFSENYLNHLRVIVNLGLHSTEPIDYKGTKIVPVEFLKHLLPDPASPGENYTGKTCIGVQVEGIDKNGKPLKKFIYNVCDHHENYLETGVHAVPYTTGVPAMIGALLIVTSVWKGEGVFNMEQFDPDPFMEKLNIYGLPWHETTF